MRWPGCSFPGRGAARRAGRRPARRAAADVADPAAAALQRHRRRLRRAGARPISASGWRIPASACRSRSICCATTWPACRARSWNRRASTAPATSRSSSRSCCRCRFPALASFAIFQFLWVWNDLLVAMVFLGAQDDKLVLTGRLVNLLGSRGGNWEILTASALRLHHRAADRVLRRCSATSSAACSPARSRVMGKDASRWPQLQITNLSKVASAPSRSSRASTSTSSRASSSSSSARRAAASRRCSA